MSRQKKIKTVQIEAEKKEVLMTNETVLDNIQTEIDLARVELEKVKKEIEEKKQEMDLAERRDYDDDEKRIVEKQITSTNERKASDNVIEQQKAYDNVPVTGRFMNLRNPGQPVKLPYIKYPDDPVKWHPFEHNKVYTIPRGFADQINDYYHMPKFIQREGPMNPDTPQSQVAAVDTSQKKYAFVPVGFN